MALTTLFGTAQLAVQDAISNGLDLSRPIPVAPNFFTISLDRQAFSEEYPGDVLKEREVFRNLLGEHVNVFLSSHSWDIGGNGELISNIILRSVDKPCTVQARTVDVLYRLAVHDDRGSRTVDIRSLTAVVGRAHAQPPRSFIPLTDSSNYLSRKHIMLRYSDLRLTAKLLGSNTTTLNGKPMGAEDMVVDEGDTIACQHCTITVQSLVR